MTTNIQATELTAVNMACTNHPDLFQHPALDYDPRDEEYTDLTPTARADLQDTKAGVEASAKAVCFECPALTGCAKKFMTINVSGVVGGLTLAERRTARKTFDLTVQDDTKLIEHLVTGRGAHRRIDADVVTNMTNAGSSAEEIAFHLECNPRTVVRARERARTQAANGTTPQTAPAPREASATDVGLLLAAAQETINAAARSARPARRARTHKPTIRTSAATPTRTTPALTLCPTPLSPAAGVNNTTSTRTIRLSTTSNPMKAMLTLLQDGQWHDQETLITTAVPHVPANEAISWWTRANSTPTPTGTRTLNPARTRTPLPDQITAGARSKVANMLSASARTRHQTERNTTHQYRFTTAGATAWADAHTPHPIAA